MSKTLELMRRIGCCCCSSSSSFNCLRHPSVIISSPQLSLSSSSLFKPPQFSSHYSTQSSNDDVPKDVSTPELKERIDKYLHGDMDAIPSIFEAILARKLSGNHENSDDEIMEEFMSKTPHIAPDDDDDDDDFDSESDESLSESDEEFSD